MKTQEVEYHYYVHDKKYHVCDKKNELSILNIVTNYKLTISHKDFLVGFRKWYSEINKDLIIKWKKEYKQRKKDYEKEYKRKYPFKYEENYTGTNIEDFISHLIKENNL